MIRRAEPRKVGDAVREPAAARVGARVLVDEV